MTNIHAFFLERGAFLRVVGDDVKSGDPMLPSVFNEEKDVWLGVLQVVSISFRRCLKNLHILQ